MFRRSKTNFSINFSKNRIPSNFPKMLQESFFYLKILVFLTQCVGTVSEKFFSTLLHPKLNLDRCNFNKRMMRVYIHDYFLPDHWYIL